MNNTERIRQSIDRSLWGGILLVALVVFAALLAPLLTSWDPYEQHLDRVLEPPSKEHVLGTDQFGRDVWSRLIFGGRISLQIALYAAAIATLIGCAVGTIAGLAGGWIDRILMRIVDMLLGFPKLFILLLAIGFGYPSIWRIVVVLGLLSWMDMARILRGELQVLRELLYVKAARAQGLGLFRIIRRHILPNVVGVILVSAALLIAALLLVEASLSFLGVGVQPPIPSWGTLLNHGRQYPVVAWWLALFAGLSVVVTVIGFHLWGDGLRNRLDVHLEEGQCKIQR